MSISNTHLKLIQLGDDYYYLTAYRLLDESGNEHSYEDIIAQAKLELKVVDTLPPASEQTLNALYLVQEPGTSSGTYTEYVTVRVQASRAVAEVPKFSGSGTPTTRNILDDGVLYKTDYAIIGNSDNIYGGAVFIGTTSYSIYTLCTNDFTVWINNNGVKTYTASSTEGNYKYVNFSTGLVAGQTLEFPVFNSLQDIIDNINNVQYIYVWEKIGTTEADLSEYSKNTHYHNVTPETVYLTASATNGSVNVSGTQNFVVDYPGVTTDVSLVNSLGNVSEGIPSSWGATVDGNGVLSFSWTAGTPTSVTLPTFNNVTVLNSLGTANVASAITGIDAMVQPTITLTKSNTNSTNAVSVANNTVIQSTQAIAAS